MQYYYQAIKFLYRSAVTTSRSSATDSPLRSGAQKWPSKGAAWNNYFDCFEEKLPMKVYIFRKAASAALQKMHTFAVDILII